MDKSDLRLDQDIEFQQAIYDSLNLPTFRNEQQTNDVLDTKRLFLYIEQNFEKLKDIINLTSILPILHRVVEQEASSANLDIDIEDHVCKLINQHKGEDDGLNVILQILYQVLKTLEGKDKQSVHVGGEVYHALLNLLFVERSRVLHAKVLTCLKLYVRRFKATNFVQQLWQSLTQTKLLQVDIFSTAQIIIQLFDEFMQSVSEFQRDENLVAIIQRLITSDLRDERKSGYYLMKKVLTLVFDRDVSQWELDKSLVLSRHWIPYITIMENLEENQSHLILPSLEALISMENFGTTWKKWMNILYIKLLAHKNILVRRWTLEYFLRTTSCQDLHPEVLLQFLEALNYTSLYNVEGYFLPKKYIGSFLQGDCLIFLEYFSKIPWKTVPMHFWLTQIRTHVKSVDNVTKELLFQIAARVRVLQNPSLRKLNIQLVENIFLPIIESMQLGDYVAFVETLYNTIDPYHHLDTFTNKIEKCHSVNDCASFTRRFFEIISNTLNEFSSESEATAAFRPILKFLAEVPKEQQAWLRFLVVFEAEPTAEVIAFCHRFYDIDLDALASFNLVKLRSELHEKLVWNEAEKPFMYEKAVDIFVCRSLMEFSDIAELDVSVEELLELGSERTLIRLSELLANNDEFLNHSILEHFLRALKKFSKSESLCKRVVPNILKYFDETQSPELGQQCAEAILNMNFENTYASIPLGRYFSTECYVKGLLWGDAKTGDARIEEAYEVELLEVITPNCLIRNHFSRVLAVTPQFLTDVCEALLQRNEELSHTKPRHFENSTEHRLKTRIACAILKLTMACDYNHKFDVWKLLLDQNNQPNVTYIYEYLTAKLAKWDDILAHLEKVAQCTPSQQVSLICVAQNWCLLNFSKITEYDLHLIIGKLFPLTMGATFQTRLYAQLALYNIFEKWESYPINFACTPVHIQMKEAVGGVLGEQRTELLRDVRLRMWELAENRHSAMVLTDIIMYITCAPYDEYNYVRALQGKFDDFRDARALFMRKRKIITATQATLSLENTIKSDISIQRKMNPTSDVLVNSNLISYPDNKDKEIYVVGSLIDKLPNLGGIARTCEVLGIKNLVLHSKSDIEKNDFKNISMTAEKSLNILEIKATALVDFLIQKQVEGFKIVGAEQTATSTNFVDFKFPKKCVLLLGHEKEGIPPHLLGFLDFAVEIPQFGMVRSLNVHVTAAIFMWEYCKQHIVES